MPSSSVSFETLASHLINASVNRQTAENGPWWWRSVGSEGRFHSGGGGIVGGEERRWEERKRERERVRNERAALRLEIKRRNKWLIMRPAGENGRIQSGTKLFVRPTAFAATVYHDPTTILDDDEDDEDGGWKSELSSDGTLRWSEEKRKRPLSRNTKQPPTVPDHYSACRARMLHHGRDCGATREELKLTLSSGQATFLVPSREMKKKRGNYFCWDN